MVITYAIGFNLKVSNRSEWIRVIGVIICAVWLLKKLETPGYIATSIIGLSVIPSHVLMVKSSQISPDLPNSRKFLTSLADRSRTTYMETIGETWKSEISEMRKKSGITMISPSCWVLKKTTLVRRNSTFHEDCLSIPWHQYLGSNYHSVCKWKFCSPRRLGHFFGALRWFQHDFQHPGPQELPSEQANHRLALAILGRWRRW